MSLARTIITIVRSLTGMFNVTEIHETKRFSGEGIRRLHIRTPFVTVRLRSTKEGEGAAALTGEVSSRYKDAFVFDVRRNEDALEISVERTAARSFFFGWMVNRLTLDVRLPDNVYESIALHSSSGDVFLQDVAAGTVTVKTSSGDVQAIDLRAEDRCFIRSSSGDVRATNIGAKRIDMEATSGAFLLKNITAETLTVSATSGGIKAFRIAGHHFRAEASSGDLQAADVSVKRFSARTRSGDMELHHIVAGHVQFSASSGDISVAKVSGALDIETSSGDIRILSDALTDDCRLRATSGDIDIKLADPSDVMLFFSSSSGQGRVQVPAMVFQEKSDHIICGMTGSGRCRLHAQTSSGNFRLS